MIHYDTPKKIAYWASRYGLSPEEIEDLKQEYHLRQLEGLNRFQSAQHFVIDALRRQGFDVRRGMPSIHQARTELKIDPGIWTDPTRVTRLTEALKGYSLDERVMLILTYLWGMTPKEISFVIGLTEYKVIETLRELKK